MTSEKTQAQFDGWAVLGVILLLVICCIGGLKVFRSPGAIVSFVGLFIFDIFLTAGFFTVEPNEGIVLLLFGKYKGTEKKTGFRWANPLYRKKKISLRVRNFDSDKLKVNDKKGNPIEISAVVVWRVKDTAMAVFEVDDFLNYVHIQSESALRHCATIYPYDTYETEDEISLRSSIDEVSEALKIEIQDRTAAAGVEIIEARINHLSYATEIAQAMLRRQQAEAIIAARQKIVEGAVGMVEIALDRLQKNNVVEFDEERKANMVSNLMCVLCSEEATQPIINTGSLY
ncbi:MAG: SPFH domain-containing protein [Candidatus Latescibacteria bacterium]|nr:SPFH domain-containing protein [Candidatus Latescibacterota bacterium]